MKNIKYKNDKKEFMKELRTDVNNYFKNKGLEKHGGMRILIKTLFMLMVYFGPYGLMISGVISSLGPVLICWVIMGFGMSGLGLVTMHDANHGTFSKYSWVNNFFGGSMYLLGGFPVNWKYQHNTLHHNYTNIEGHDDDIGHEGILRFSPHKPLKKIHKFQHLYAWFLYGIMTLYWASAKDFNQINRYKNKTGYKGKKMSYPFLLSKLIISKILYYTIFLIIPLLFISLAWYWVLTGFIVMHFTSGLLLTTIFQTAHVVPSSDYPLPDYENELENNWAIHQLHTTSDFAHGNKIFSWLIGGLNYQVVHHLFPNISHVHYEDLAVIVKKKAEKYQLPYYVNKTFLGAIYQHVLMLKLLGEGKDLKLSK